MLDFDLLVIDGYLNGLSSDKLSKKYNCSKSKILGILKKNSIKRRSKKIFVPEEKEKIVLERYKAGETIQQIKEETGLGEKKIYEILHCSSAVRNRNKKIDNETKDKIHFDFINGLKPKDIAEKYKIEEGTVRRFLKEYGITFERVAHNKTDEKIKNKIVAEYSDGLNICELHEKYGFGTTTIARWVNEAGEMRSLSSAFSLSANKGRKHFRGSNLPWYSEKNKRWFVADSLWEAVRMEQLDKENDVVCWEKNTERIQYVGLDKKQHYYIPDFKIFYTEKISVEEIKPSNLVDDETNQIKISTAQKYYAEIGIEYKVITEKEIGIDNIKNFNSDGLISYTQELRKQNRKERRNKRAREIRYAKKNNYNRNTA